MEAIRLFADYPHLSNREVARQLGVSESTVRAWKKQSVWHEESERIAEERLEMTLEVLEEERDKFKQELRQEFADLKKIRDAVKTNAALFLKISNNALRELTTSTSDFTRASSKAVKSGVNKHSESAIKAAEAVARLDDKIYQVEILLEHFEKENNNQG